MKSIIPEPMIPKPFRIYRKLKETHDTYTIELAPTNGADGFPFSAGQFNMVYVFGVGEVPISISGDPSIPKMLRHTTRSVGTVTKAILKLRNGDVLGVRGPFGSHWPVNEAVGNDVVIVAGGIGLAPLRPALYFFISHRDKYGKKFYDANPEARIARAHVVFYSRWCSAHENGHRWTLEQKQSWDENVRDDLSTYCKEEALNTYLGNTRPSDEDPLTGISPLQENAFAKAVNDIKLLLDGRLKIFIK